MKDYRPTTAGILVGLLLPLLLTCGADVVAQTGAEVGSVIRDAGAMLMDASRLIGDAAGTADAEAQVPNARMLSAACDRTAEWTTASPTSMTVSTTRYAEILVPGLDPARSPTITAFACDSVPDPDNTYDPYACPAGSTCTGAYYRPLRCSLAGYSVDAGKLQVTCGQRSFSRSGATTIINGYTNRTVHVSIRD